jgi:nucleoside 2-deoxyribosyltransferase
MKIIYLASPYSHPEESIRQRRYHLACRTAAKLMASDIVVFSPLANTIPAVEFGGLELSHQGFLRLDLPMLRRCDELLLLCLDGWQESIGVQQELGEAIAFHKPITTITEAEIERLPAVPKAAKCYLTSSIFTEVYDATC